MNVAPAVETTLPRQNEIIIAVPTVSSSNERKSITSKRTQIISFEDDENASAINNNAWASSTPPSATVPLSQTCLKYQEKERLAKEKLKTIKTDSTYERIMNTTDPMNTPKVINISHTNVTDVIKPESPTAIQIFDPSPSSSFDFKESDLSASKMSSSDNSSITSNTTSQSEKSVHNLESSQPQPDVDDLSTGADDNEVVDDECKNVDSLNADIMLNDTTQIISNREGKYLARIQELESRCASLEEQVTTLTLYVHFFKFHSKFHLLLILTSCAPFFGFHFLIISVLSMIEPKTIHSNYFLCIFTEKIPALNQCITN